MNTFNSIVKKVCYTGILLSLQPALLSALSAQNISKEIRLKNNSSTTVVDYTAEIAVENLSLPFGDYVAEYNGTIVPVEISKNVNNKQFAIFPIDKIEPNKELKITIKSGTNEGYPKRTYAELAHKIGG